MIVGIDPGQKGGLAAFGEVLFAMPMPADLGDLVAFFEKRKIEHVFCEKVHSMPGNRAGAMLNYGMGFGQILGIIATLKIPLTLVRPADWMREMHRGTSAGTTKERSLEAARRLWPGYDWGGTARSSKPHDGMYEAALIAAYGRRIISGDRHR